VVGPGVEAGGVDGETWSDHTDIRPTILALVGLTDDYAHDGRVLVETMSTPALPPAVSRPTTGLAGRDATYQQIESQIASFTKQRDSPAAQMIQLLEAAAFGGQPIDATKAGTLESQAAALLQQVRQAVGG
jgi:hypothetical protein